VRNHGGLRRGADRIVDRRRGNRRVESDTIRSYFRLRAGERLDAAKVDEGIKALIATGLFSDVRPTWSGGRVIITVVEKSGHQPRRLRRQQARQGRAASSGSPVEAAGAFSLPMVQSDVQRIVEIYRRNGRYDIRVTPRVIDRPNNRVDLVFEIAEGGKTTIKDIDFVGNRAYSTWRLRDVIKTGQSNLLSFLKNNDLYDPDRVEADRDLLAPLVPEERLRGTFVSCPRWPSSSPRATASFSPSPSRKASGIRSARSISSRACATSTSACCARGCASRPAAPTTPKWSRNRSRR
jgi:hypothetical protein